MSKKSKLFSKLVRKWVYKTYLPWWEIKINYMTRKNYKKCESVHDGSVASCHASWKYLTATINVNLYEIKKLNKEELEYVVVHELMHVFLEELREDGIEHEERIATVLAKSFILHENQMKEKKK